MGRGAFARGAKGDAISRPQEKFSPRVDNSNTPFVHTGSHYPARLAAKAVKDGDVEGDVNQFPGHPLGLELSTLVFQPWQLEAGEAVAPG